MRFSVLMVWSAGLASCAVASPPAEKYFEIAWGLDDSNRRVQSLPEYLEWVTAFYQGSAFVPGWERRQGALCASLDGLDARTAPPLLESLGRLLCSEWAKDNRIRLIDSEQLRIWAEALQEAQREGRLVDIVDEILLDVRAILAGDLAKTDVTSERYSHSIATE